MNRRLLLLVAVGLGPFALTACAADWPQWRGPNRDARAVGFDAPKTWPKQLTQKWKVAVGDGVASPALVGDKVYVFTLQDGYEVTRCLEAATGKELWRDRYEAEGAAGPAARFAGPRSSPTVAQGKVVTLGVRGTLSCLDAATGRKVWRKDTSEDSLPRFFTSSSPLVVGGLCVAQLGGEREGAIVAYDLATGKEKWKWAGDGTAYASPVLLTAAGVPMIVAETAQYIVGIGVADGKLLWYTPYPVEGRGYNASTPLVDDPTVIFSGSGRGTRAVKIAKQDGTFAAKELWSNPENSVQFNTPVLKDGLVFGLSDRDNLFCINARNGKTAWTAPLGGGGGSGPPGRGGPDFRGRGGRGFRGRGGSGYGSIVDAGPVLLALTPRSQLIVFQPSDKEYKQVASYKVADGDTYAYPVADGKRLFVKGRDALTLWTIE
jgi:outer membrane protein assembly factor BamB